MKITIAKERLSREKMSGNLPSNEILEKYKFKNGYEITDLGNGYVSVQEKQTEELIDFEVDFIKKENILNKLDFL